MCKTVAFTGVVVTLAVGWSAAIAPALGQSAKPRVYMNTASLGSTPSATYRPRSIKNLVQDGSVYVTGISWTGWGTLLARGIGTLHQDNCDPSCAQGTYNTRKVQLRAYRIRTCDAILKREYTRLRVSGLLVGEHSVIDQSFGCVHE